MGQRTGPRGTSCVRETHFLFIHDLLFIHLGPTSCTPVTHFLYSSSFPCNNIKYLIYVKYIKMCVYVCMYVCMQYVCACMRVPGGAGSTPCRYTCACVHACGGLELFLLKCVPFYHYCELASKKGTCDQKSHNTGRLLPPLEKVCSSLVSNTHQAQTRFELCEPGFWREQRTGQTRG